MLAEVFRENLIAALEETGMSQILLSQRSGVTRLAINRIILGHQSPRLETCEMIADGLGLPPAEMFVAKEG